jgi:hypothetical protein
MKPTFSLQHTNTIITVASWEERFLLGMEQLIANIAPSRILMFHYKEYSDWSEKNRTHLSDVCNNKGIELIKDKELSFTSPLDSWKYLVAEIKTNITSNELITLDISTMPRETIWSICHVLTQQHFAIQYTYHKPQHENGYANWLSRDPGRPRLLYKQAGIQHLGRPTMLVIQTGYDVERAKQLERFFEPERVLLGLQIGGQFGNAEQNRDKHEKAFFSRRDIDLFDVDGYTLESIYKVFADRISPLIDKYNIILSSLGPKVGALALFKIKQDWPDVALCYAPSNEFNRKYSRGIGDCICGELNATTPR